MNRNVTEMYVNYGLRNGRCSVYKVEIISLAFKWLIILRPAIKAHKHTKSLKMQVYASCVQAVLYSMLSHLFLQIKQCFTKCFQHTLVDLSLTEYRELLHYGTVRLTVHVL